MIDAGDLPAALLPEHDYLTARRTDANQWRWMVGEDFHALRSSKRSSHARPASAMCSRISPRKISSRARASMPLAQSRSAACRTPGVAALPALPVPTSPNIRFPKRTSSTPMRRSRAGSASAAARTMTFRASPVSTPGRSPPSRWIACMARCWRATARARRICPSTAFAWDARAMPSSRRISARGHAATGSERVSGAAAETRSIPHGTTWRSSRRWITSRFVAISLRHGCAGKIASGLWKVPTG